MNNVNIRPTQLTTKQDLQPLLQSSLDEGYDFVQKLWDEYQSGKNRFDARGAVLLAVYRDEALIGVGGVHPDPYLPMETRAGRIRHVYVMPNERRTGVGRQLLDALIAHAQSHFTVLTLRTTTTHGDAFYREVGFETQPRFADATHWMALKTNKTSIE